MTFQHLIDPHTFAGEGLDVLNPATGALLATVRDRTGSDVDGIVATAVEAMPEWAALTARDRAGVLMRWHALIHRHRQRIGALVTAECGKPLPEADVEVTYAASLLEWFAEEGKRAYGEIIPHHAPGKRLLTLRQPIGVVAAITPWNFPVAMVTRKVAPALAAGCAVVLKPAEQTPLSALALRTLAIEAGVPENLFQIVTSSDPDGVGKALCADGRVRKLSFTGSTEVGKLLMAQCAATVKKVGLELGGNAPFIVFDDADPDAAIDGLMACKFRNAGQACVSANRILVQDGVHDALVERLTGRVESLRVGDGSGDKVDIGPLIDAAGLAKVRRLVDQARSAGAIVRTGGGPHAAGDTFFEPTVLEGVAAAMDIANTEIFGPVAPVMRFVDEAEAIRLANDTPYGLAAYFYSRDIGRIWRVLERLEYGMVGVNEGLLSAEAAPFGGIKESGIGREGSRHGLEEFLEIKYAVLGGIGR